MLPDGSLPCGAMERFGHMIVFPYQGEFPREQSPILPIRRANGDTDEPPPETERVVLLVYLSSPREWRIHNDPRLRRSFQQAKSLFHNRPLLASRPQSPFGDELLEPFQREYDVEVPVRIPVVVVVVGNHDLAGDRRGGDHAKCRVPGRVVHVERGCGSHMNPRYGRQAYPTCRRGLYQRNPSTRFVLQRSDRSRRAPGEPWHRREYPGDQPVGQSAHGDVSYRWRWDARRGFESSSPMRPGYRWCSIPPSRRSSCGRWCAPAGLRKNMPARSDSRRRSRK